MTPRTLTTLALLAALGATLPPAAAAPEGPAAKAGGRLRAALPEPSSEGGLVFFGELWEGARWRGSLRVEVSPSASGEMPVWTSREELRWVDGEVGRRRLASYTLTRDLAVERVDLEQEQGGVLTLASYAREGAALAGIAREVKGDEEGVGRPVTLAWPRETTAGVGAALLLARAHLHGPDDTVEVPWVLGEGFMPSGTPAPRTLAFASQEPVKGREGLAAIDTAMTPGAGSGAAAGRGRLLLRRSDGAVQGWANFAGALDLWPTGTKPEALTLDESAPARTWQDAFLTFGIGYHMAQPALLERAFHWPTMWKYECSLEGGWPRERPVADFQKAWIDEFVAQSKHRSRDETMQLLNGTMGTGRVEVRNADLVVLHAVAQFGGGVQRTYHVKRMPDGIWYLTRIDSAE